MLKPFLYHSYIMYLCLHKTSIIPSIRSKCMHNNIRYKQLGWDDMHSLFRWVILAVFSSALLLVAIDMTVLYTALPRLTQGSRGFCRAKLWIVILLIHLPCRIADKYGSVLNDRYGAKCFLNIGCSFLALHPSLLLFP